ncbi:MAG: PASTA domain-containing protein [Alloprevotella sp.]|nr:PASTA domain-containing protein [Alloprevotella sp.]MBR1652866.1 PASTA domain-containing protein [Alloprevotella sp.]MBR1653167.1 PASTA domain-containing protein [Alloprevotella sp.]
MTSREFFRKSFSGYLWGNCLGMLVLAALLMGGVAWFLEDYTHHGETIEIPNVVGKNVRAVESQFEQLGLKLEVVDTGYIKTLPADIILQQTVKPGTVVKPGRSILVTVNAAHAQALALPDLADNSSYREAESKLKAMGFHLTAPKYTSGDRDWVYGLEANGRPVRTGERIAVDVPITLVIGDGHVYEEYNGGDSTEASPAPVYTPDDGEEIDESIQ